MIARTKPDALDGGVFFFSTRDILRVAPTTGGERKTHTLENSAECVIATLDEMEFESYSLFGDQVHGSVIAA